MILHAPVHIDMLQSCSCVPQSRFGRVVTLCPLSLTSTGRRLDYTSSGFPVTCRDGSLKWDAEALLMSSLVPQQCAELEYECTWECKAKLRVTTMQNSGAKLWVAAVGL